MTTQFEMISGRLAGLALALLAACVLPLSPAKADPADIDAAARGVVRIIVIEDQDGELYPLSHGTGFAVTPEKIVTNAHVIAEARGNRNISIGIVPSDGGDAIYGRILDYSPRNDLALLATTSPMNLPPLTIAGNASADSGQVTSVGYPMNVDRAQGLDNREIFMPQPPVKSQGFLSGRRPTREFDTILHTAPIARGSSGGPLLDTCGRVVGVNSFGTESSGTDSEFYFAVSTRELLPFLRKNDIAPQVNGLPCRSLADVDAEERLRAEREMLAAQRQSEAERSLQQQRESLARRSAEFEVISERENGMMLAFILLLAGLGGGYATWLARQEEDQRKLRIAGGITALAIVGALASWLMRPGFDTIEERVNEALASKEEPDEGPSGVIEQAADLALVCVVNVGRSRITGGSVDDVPLTWSDDGCVNGRTQYGLSDGRWTRILVPNDEAAVSVASFDPDSREYRVERYLLSRGEMDALREARGQYRAPECGAGEGAARELGSNQAILAAMLPASPNERLVYDCAPAEFPAE
ncbi:MAG TPA: serine protease [Sphingomonadaceae bacterium]|nr:serine protease [Sphingomonadaceae bacterium]